MKQLRDSNGRFASKKIRANADSIEYNRLLLSRLAGMQYNGERDIDTVLGYTTNPSIKNYHSMYDRRGIASVIVDAPAKTTWRKTPLITDGSEGKSDFMTQLTLLIDKLSVFNYLERVDRLAGVGQYGVLLIGAKGGELSQPLQHLSGPNDIIFLSSFSQLYADVKSLSAEPNDPRFGKPIMYSINLGGDINGQDALGIKDVHWTRIIHVAEGLLENEVYGEPRLQKIYNRLEDLDKIVGSSAEGYWQSAAKGYAINPKEGFELSPGDITAAKDEWQNFIHGLQRIMVSEGMDVQELKGDAIDPTAAFDVVMSIISGTKGIPKRILLGSERGDLASTQDEANWLGHIAERQIQYAEPQILRAFIDRLISVNALPAPNGGVYAVGWEPLFYLNEIELGKVHSLNANAVRNMIGKDGDPRLLLTMSEQRIMLGLPAEMEGDSNGK